MMGETVVRFSAPTAPLVPVNTSSIPRAFLLVTILSGLSLAAGAQTLLDPGASAEEMPSADVGGNSLLGRAGNGVGPGSAESLLHPGAAVIPAGAPRGTFSIGAKNGSGTGADARSGPGTAEAPTGGRGALSQWMVVFLDQNERAFPGAHTLDASPIDAAPSTGPAKGPVAAPKKNENAPMAGPDKSRSGPLFRMLRLAVPGLATRVLVDR